MDIETEICTSLKSEFYFRFRWPRSIKSTLISYISVRVFVTIRGKICPPQSRNCQNRILHISKIGNLLPVCPRNNSVLNNHIYERYAKFGENRLRIADVIVRQPIGGQTHGQKPKWLDSLSKCIWQTMTSRKKFTQLNKHSVWPWRVCSAPDGSSIRSDTKLCERCQHRQSCRDSDQRRRGLISQLRVASIQHSHMS